MRLIELWKCTNSCSIGVGNSGIITYDTTVRKYETGVLTHSIQLHKGQLFKVDGFNFYTKTMICTVNNDFQVAIPFNDVPNTVSIHNTYTGDVHGMCFVNTKHDVVSVVTMVYITTGLVLLGSILCALLW